MLRYTIKDYKREMIRYRRRMPKNWISNHIANEHPKISDEAKEKLKISLLNTSLGNNFLNGVKKGYINVMRKAYAEHNNVEYVPLPDEVVVY